MPVLSDETLVLLGILIVMVLAMLYTLSRFKHARPGERLVVYEKGRTNRRLIVSPVIAGRPDRGSRVFVSPIAGRRLVRVQGDLVDAWDKVRAALSGGWGVEPPVEGRVTTGWIVQAHGPHDEVVEGHGSTESEALEALADHLDWS